MSPETPETMRDALAYAQNDQIVTDITGLRQQLTDLMVQLGGIMQAAEKLATDYAALLKSQECDGK